MCVGASLRSHRGLVTELEFRLWLAGHPGLYPYSVVYTAKFGGRSYSHATDKETKDQTNQAKPSPGSEHAWENPAEVLSLPSCLLIPHPQWHLGPWEAHGTLCQLSGHPHRGSNRASSSSSTSVNSSFPCSAPLASNLNATIAS